MKAALLVDTRDLRLSDIEEPVLGAGDVLIETSVGGICGSDVHTYLGRHPFRSPPVVLGHETAGVVCGVGEEVEGIQSGELVTIEPQISCRTCAVCRRGLSHLCPRARRPGAGAPGTFAQRIAVPAEIVYKLPAGVSAEDGALVEPAAVALRALRRAGVRYGDAVAVLGAGSIGCLAVVMADALGARVVLASDPKPFNREIVSAIGAGEAADPASGSLVERVMELTDGVGVDAVIVACSAGDALIDAVAASCRGGKVVQVALHERRLELDATEAVLKEVDVLSSFTYSSEDFGGAVQMVAGGVVSADRLVTRTYGFEEADKAFGAMVGGLDHIKVQLRF